MHPITGSGMVNNTFFHERMIFCHQRIFAQYPAGHQHDNSNKSESHPEIKKFSSNMFRRTLANTIW